MQTDTLAREPHSLIASDRVEGTPVRRSNGDKIGTIQRLMIDKISGKVAYAVLSFGGFLGLGQKHLPIPWSRLTYDRLLGAYQLDLTDEELSRAPAFASDADFDWGDRSGEVELHTYYRVPPYWGVL
jgi:PRC-barrel domain